MGPMPLTVFISCMCVFSSCKSDELVNTPPDASVFHIDSLKTQSPSKEHVIGEKELVFLNHITEIRTHLDEGRCPENVLIDEKGRLSVDWVNLDSLNTDICKAYMDLRRFISSVHVSSEEMKVIKKEYHHELLQSFLSCGLSLEKLNNKNEWVSHVAESTSNALYGMSQVRERYIRKKFKVFIDQIQDIDALNETMIGFYLGKNIGNNDKYILRVEEIKALEDEVNPERIESNGVSAITVFDWLKTREETYRYYPAYWFCRCNFASKCRKNQDVVFACDQYKDLAIKYPLSHKNPQLAEVLLMKMLACGVSGKMDFKTLRHELDICTENLDDNNWADGYIAAVIAYKYLNDKKTAAMILKKFFAPLFLSVNEEMKNFSGKNKSQVITHMNSMTEYRKLWARCMLDENDEDLERQFEAAENAEYTLSIQELLSYAIALEERRGCPGTVQKVASKMNAVFQDADIDYKWKWRGDKNGEIHVWAELPMRLVLQHLEENGDSSYIAFVAWNSEPTKSGEYVIRETIKDREYDKKHKRVRLHFVQKLSKTPFVPDSFEIRFKSPSFPFALKLQTPTDEKSPEKAFLKGSLSPSRWVVGKGVWSKKDVARDI